VHFPRTRLICLENTHNRCNGSALTPQYTDAVAALAKNRGLAVHLDGARIFNAAVALGVDVKELTRSVDSLSFCLSKGLSAPIGSVVCGSKKFIAQARRIRKVLGGGMRQSGIIAAAGIVALKEMPARIAEDHKNARRLAEGIARVKGLSIDLAKIQTNIVYFELRAEQLTADLPSPAEAGYAKAGELVAGLTKKGIRLLSVAPRRLRAVTHYGITTEDIDLTVTALGDLMQGCQWVGL